MGIVNVTPDSFSDGGRMPQTERAIAHGLQLAKEGADILDVGGESTRPGSEGVPEDEELARVIPVIEALAKAGHQGLLRHAQGRGHDGGAGGRRRDHQ